MVKKITVYFANGSYVVIDDVRESELRDDCLRIETPFEVYMLNFREIVYTVSEIHG